MYGDIVEDIRDTLAITAENDRTILRGIKKAARTLLLTYDFREAVRRVDLPILATAQTVALPADVGKIRGVQLRTVENGVMLYKPLKRREETQLPTWQGPTYYRIEGTTLFLDQPMPSVIATPYTVTVWYQSNDADQAEPWLSTVFEGPLENLAGLKIALKKRKAEAATIYGNLWQQDTVMLARYVAESQFSDMDMGMGERSDAPGLERYPA